MSNAAEEIQAPRAALAAAEARATAAEAQALEAARDRAVLSGAEAPGSALSRRWDSVFGGGSWDNTALGRATTQGGAADNVGNGYDRAMDSIAERPGVPGMACTAIDFAAPGYSETRDGLIDTYDAAASGDVVGVAVGAANAGLGVLGGKGRLAKKGLTEAADLAADPKVKAIAADQVHHDLAGEAHYEKTLRADVQTLHVAFQELNRGQTDEATCHPER